MTHSIEDLHVYLRSIRADERTSLSVLASLIKPQTSVLDLGCGSGALGQFLAINHGCVTDGLTLSEAEADHARPYYRAVHVSDLEACDLLAVFPAQKYDYIVCADVLEHLRKPERILETCRQLLAPAGKLLISVPNAAYCGLIAELMQGEFRYRDEGLLDKTHLRFFTRSSLLRFLGEQRWAVDYMDTIHRELPDSEFDAAFDRLPPALSRHLLSDPDALTYQYICAAQPCSAKADHLLPAQPQTKPFTARFTAQLYLGRNGSYDEAHKLTAAGIIGDLRQTLRFTLTPHHLPVTQLRLDPADRPGFVHLYKIVLSTVQDDVLWQWVSDAGTAPLLINAHQQQIAWCPPMAASGGTALLLTGDEPWFELPIPAGTLAKAPQGGLVLEVDLGWPMSSDYMSLAAVIAPLMEEQQFLRGKLDCIPTLMQEQEQLALEHANLHRQHEELLKQKAREQLERNQLFFERETAYKEITNLHEQLRGMAAHVENLRNLRSVRYSRALARWLRPSHRLLMRQQNADHSSLTSNTQSDDLTQATPTPLPMSDTIDVIVPVYRGLADTKLCLESVLASPVHSAYRLIVINDASPEPAVTQWLREKAALEPRITLLENSRNLGFVGTVNLGMKQSTSNDVVLLNSDTEVANNWLDRLRKAAYRSAKAGTVTPFSSNATICSYPIFCAANPLPQGETTASLDQLFAAANPGQAVEVPTGVGFCMYIRRDCLSQVGWFDEERFGKGYGEENDFCQRALSLGWRNLHALDTYVLHTGGVSFGESKSPREQAALETLRKLHPTYEAQVTAFLQQDPANTARLAVDFLRATRNGAKPVVLAIHHDRGGGTQRHVLELAQTLAEAITFFSLKPSGSHHVLLQLIEPNTGAPESRPAPSATLSDTWRAMFDLNTDQNRLLELLHAIGVAHVHIHHLLGHHQFVWDLPQMLGVSYDFTAHDFYTSCTNITLTGRANRYEMNEHGECCGGVHPPSMPAVVEQIDAWRIRNRVLLEGARYVLTPSLETASRMLATFPSARVRCAPHTDVTPTLLAPPRIKARPSQRPLRIVVVGALSIIKGADVLEATALQALKANVPLEFHLIGFGYRHLQTSGTALTVHGEYDEADLPALLQRLAPDVAWFPALWPETYSYTLSAVLQADLPVVVPNLGAFPERIADRPWSWVQDWSNSPEQWVDFFAHIHHQITTPGAEVPRAPSLAAPLQTLRDKQGTWDYASDYLALKPVLPDQGEVSAVSKAQQVARFFAAARATASPPPAQGSRLYRMALRLQRVPMLGPFVRSVPSGWRYRIKRLLSR